MKLQGRDLFIQLHGSDVKLLQAELRKLGFRIPNEEVSQSLFGEGTKQAVNDFQKKYGLEPTGIVDEETARLINAQVDALQQSKNFIVKGKITQQDGNPLNAVTVRAFDKDLRSEEQLGETITNELGLYEITYKTEQFHRAEKKNADLIIRVFDQNETQLAASDILFNAPEEATIDLTVIPGQEIKLSEYEYLLAQLTPVLQDIQLADLTEEDITFLAGETGINPKLIGYLQQSAQLAQQTDLPTEAFYGFAHQGLSLNLDALLAQPLTLLDQTLETAIDQNIIPAKLRESIADILRRLEQLAIDRGVLATYQITGQLLNQENSIPLTGFTIHAFDLGAEPAPKDLGYSITDSQGLFSLTYAASRPSSAENPTVSDRKFKLIILNPQNQEIHQTELQIQPDQNQPIQVPIPVPKPAEPPSFAIIDLANTLQVELPTELLVHLAQQNINTLADIRSSGGISLLEGLPLPANHPTVQWLEAQADLSILSDNIDQNEILIQSGFTNVMAIAQTPEPQFLTATREKMGEPEALQLYAKADAQANFLSNVETSVLTDLANGIEIRPGRLKNPDQVSQSPPRCSCKDCETAVSPLAYLADLLSYTLKHVQNNSTAITLQSLSDTFHQPFQDLPASCEAADTPIRQVRLAIEVLRRALTQQHLDTLTQAQSNYCWAAYQSILTQLGTSYEELRLARTATSDQRKSLSDRLGIAPEHLNDLLKDPATLTEADIENLFGLVSTQRSGLAPSAVPQFKTWQLQSLRNSWREQDWNASSTSNLPLIDPDLITPDHLANVLTNNPAFTLWRERSEALRTLWNYFKTRREETGADIRAGFDEILQAQEGLGVASDEILGLEQQRKAGDDITPRLAALGLLDLSYAALSYLARIRQLLDSNNPILNSEWGDIYSILVQAYKQRTLYAQWRQQERDAGIILSPDFFKLPNSTASVSTGTLAPLPAWRATEEARRTWQDQLEARIAQEQTVNQALQTAIGATETATLPMLRDALILASGASGTTLDEKAKALGDRLLIDMKTGGCQTTTRVAQAIETLQGMLFSLRTGQLRDTYPTLELNAPNFDEEWEWIGSYATWRAAMFVFLYPENILLPTLRPRQTPAFVQLVTDLRNRRLTPEQAHSAARTYADYLRNVCFLIPEATCKARTTVRQNESQTSVEDRDLLYLFARAGDKIYWSTYDPLDSSGYGQTFWQPVSGIEEKIKITQIIGAVPSSNPVQKIRRAIFLFAFKEENGRKKLIFTTYDLDQQTWADAPTDLSTDLPENRAIVSAVVVETLENEPPSLIFLSDKQEFPSNKQELFYRPLSYEGNDWAGEQFYQLDPPSSRRAVPSGTTGATQSSRITKLNAALFFGSGVGTHMLLISQSNRGELLYQIHRILPYQGSRTSITSSPEFTWRLLSIGTLRGVFTSPNKQIYVFFQGRDSTLYQIITPSSVSTPQVLSTDLGVSQILSAPGYITNPALKARFAIWHVDKTLNCWILRQEGTSLVATDPVALKPKVRFDERSEQLFEISEQMTSQELQNRRALIAEIFNLNAETPKSNLIYLEEAFFFVPTLLAFQLQQRKYYTTALDWFRTVYDYSVPRGQRRIYYGLEQERSGDIVYERLSDWLLDPLNPHAIAATRPNTYTRFILLSLVNCLLSYADEEFTRDTSESIPRSRILYLTALELLNEPELKQQLGRCEQLIGSLNIQIGNDEWRLVGDRLQKELHRIVDPKKLERTIKEINSTTSNNQSSEARLATTQQIITKALGEEPSSPTLATVVAGKDSTIASYHRILLAQPSIAQGAIQIGKRVPDNQRSSSNGASNGATSQSIKKRMNLAPSQNFCIPPNSILTALRLKAELNLYKLRTCRNIAGLQRQLDPYAASTDAQSGLPTIGTNGQLLLPGAVTLRPTLYRYVLLLERAKQLVQMAAQIESAMLSALEKYDAETYNLLKAHQDIKLSQASVQLQNLRVQEAQSNVKLAELQQERSQIQFDYYNRLLIQGWLDMEHAALAAMWVAFGLKTAAAVGSFFLSPVSGLSSSADASSTLASIFSTYASYERRRQEWEFQESLAEKDVQIGKQQVATAQTHVQIVGQEKTIAQLQTDHAKAVVDFLSNKFTSAELYDWMSNILEGVYSFFLQQATAIAKLAENQLAFERQEVPQAIIQADYWDAPTEGGVINKINGDNPDRRGLTGSARLSQDIYQLDQYAFETNKRKLQLTKTLSLAQFAPAEFQRFRETGVMRFETSMQMFDRDFPGHYLRLIKRVRTSVIALIPPTQGIHATLSTIGTSRAVIGGDIFQTVTIRRSPESVALTSPQNATGLFELDLQPENRDMLLPFEGIGVDTSWEFQMPKAANLFDYSTIADVLITIEYTALNSFDYRQQVLQSLSPAFSGDRPFSFRNQFADQWYDLHNPDQTTTPMTVRFKTLREDFPSNIKDLKIQQLVLYIARSNGQPFEVPVTHLRFTEEGIGTAIEGGATSVGGIISSRRSSGTSWTAMIGKSPIGEWELALPNTEEIKNRFRNEEVEDILFVVTYSGRVPAYPV